MADCARAYPPCDDIAEVDDGFGDIAVETGRRVAYGWEMSITGLTPARRPHAPETVAERDARMQREDAIVAKAEADIAAGLGIDDDQVEAWLDALDRDPHTPLPSSRHGHSRR